MDLKDMLQFVKIDESFYTVLTEYGKTGNSKVVMEKVFEALFFDYGTIEKLTDGFKNKKSMDFFIGDRNEDIYLYLMKRTERDGSSYNISNFMEKVIFNSAYTNGKIYSIMYEIDNLKNNTRNVYRATDKNKEMASDIKRSLVNYFQREVASGNYKFNISNLKWIELLRGDIDEDTQHFLINSILKESFILGEDLNKNRTKLITLRNFLSERWIKDIEKILDDKQRLDIVKFLNYTVKNVIDFDPKVYGDTKRVFDYDSFLKIITTLYVKNVPDSVYKIVFKEKLKDGIEENVNSGYGKNAR